MRTCTHVYARAPNIKCYSNHLALAMDQSETEEVIYISSASESEAEPSGNRDVIRVFTPTKEKPISW